MGVSIRQKPKGSGVWWVFINHQGRRKAKKIGKDKKLAREVAKKVDAKLVLGEYEFNKNKERSPLFKEYAEQGLALPHDFKLVTGDEYHRKLKLHAFPEIGNLPICEIDKKCLQKLFDGLAIKGLSNSTIALIRVPISEVLKHAVEGDLIPRNPLRDLIFKKKKKASDFEPLNEKEAAQLLEASMIYKNGEYYPMMLTSLRTGVRVGELVALKWADINFEERLITVQRTHGRRGYTLPKNSKTRKVDMTPLLSGVLKKLQIKQKKWALQNRKSMPKFIFISESGKVQIYQNFRHALSRCLEMAKLRRIRIHDLRHTYATIRLLRGHNIGDVSYQLGHSSLSITYDIYGHWIPGKFKSEVDELDQVQPNATHVQPANFEF